MDIKNFLEDLEITYSEKLNGYYKDAVQDYKEYGDKIMQIEDYGIFTYLLEPVLKIRDSLLKNKENIIYSYLLSRALKSDDEELIESISKPKENKKNEEYDTLPLFGLLYNVPLMCEKLKEKNVPDDVIFETKMMFENQVQDFIDLYGHLGISAYVGWMRRFLQGDIIRIGRFNFEIESLGDYSVFQKGETLLVMPHKGEYHRAGQLLGNLGFEDKEGSFEVTFEETDEKVIGYTFMEGLCVNERITLSKGEWKKVATCGDRIVSVHIPSGGGLNFEENSRDFQKAAEIIGNSYGDFGFFYCDSWLLDPNIKRIMERETNLTKFGDRYLRFPSESDGEAVFSYLYMTRDTKNIENLPEKTSMQKAIKEYLLGGGYIHNYKGVFKND